MGLQAITQITTHRSEQNLLHTAIFNLELMLHVGSHTCSSMDFASATGMPVPAWLAAQESG